MSAPCECPLAGWCQRHRMEKGARLHELCQTREDYRQKFDETAHTRPLRGAGDVVATVTHKLHIPQLIKSLTGSDCAGCGQRQDLLNKWLPFK